MSDTLKISLSYDKAPAPWQDKTFSMQASGYVIHLSSKNEKQSLSEVQTAARAIQSMGVDKVDLSGDWSEEQQWAFYLGFVTAKNQQQINWSSDNSNALNERKQVFDWTRKLINLPPQDIYPLALANNVVEFITELAPGAVSHEIVMGDDLLGAGWIGIHSVGRASIHPPVMLTLDYNPTGDANAPVSTALVGKGITFDSGGYSIKPSESMVSMKCDMGGAATVAGALALAIKQGLNKRVKLILCCAENLIAGNAYKLGDILTYKNGTTVEIVNTDAEGRLVLADGLMHAEELGAETIIDAATLTGAAMMAVGADYNALFGLDKELVNKALSAAEQENEGAWPLPLEKFHRNNCPSPYADTANSRAQKGGGMGGASNAAGFLSRFVNEEGKGWLHIDLAGAFNNSSNGKYSAGATAMGVRTIARLLLDE
ncbi:MAG: aminopeptidase PepB [Gammaproteobacteria bacterium]|nr:aminopeptidase PepB [Gammaproteobacteria bacterium]